MVKYTIRNDHQCRPERQAVEHHFSGLAKETVIKTVCQFRREITRSQEKGPSVVIAIADKIFAVFDQECQRNTRPRRVIAERLAELARSGSDFSMDDLWQELRLQEPRLGRATVYRS